MNTNEIIELLKLKKYILTLDDYLEIIKNEQVRKIYYKDDNFHMITDDNYELIFKIKK